MPPKPNNGVKPNRYIYSELKSKRKTWEEEHPIRWSFMKILREFSTLKEFYPEITPYHEAYKVRDNTWAVYTESFDGAGDPWMYIINGPQKALVVDTGFGVGDLRGLAEKLTGKKDIVAANTHHHFDHAYGNAQFETVYCHEDEVFNIRNTMNPHIWDYLYDPVTREGIYSEFDPDDIIEYKEYNLVPLKSNECIDLGDGYLVECIPLRGHSTGMSGWLDHQTGCLFAGDLTGVSPAKPGDPHPENGTVERLRDDFTAIVARLDEISGVFPGHGMWDQTNTMLKYELDTLNAILEKPDNADKKRVMHMLGGDVTVLTKNIHQGTAVKYRSNNVYYSQVKK